QCLCHYPVRDAVAAHPPRFFVLRGPRRHPALPSFPTRRSSDLGAPPRLTDPPRPWKNAMGMRAFSPTRVSAAWALLSSQLEARKDRKSTRLNSSHVKISYAVFCLKKKKTRRCRRTRTRLHRDGE